MIKGITKNLNIFTAKKILFAIAIYFAIAILFWFHFQEVI